MYKHWSIISGWLLCWVELNYFVNPSQSILWYVTVIARLHTIITPPPPTTNFITPPHSHLLLWPILGVPSKLSVFSQLLNLQSFFPEVLYIFSCINSPLYQACKLSTLPICADQSNLNSLQPYPPESSWKHMLGIQPSPQLENLPAFPPVQSSILRLF